MGSLRTPNIPRPEKTPRQLAHRTRDVTQEQILLDEAHQRGRYWMRSVSFAGLHRLLSAIADAKTGLTAKEINNLVLNKKVTLTPGNPRPAPTTLYHYRNTLLRLQLLKRINGRLQVNVSNPNVRALLHLSVPVNQEQSLSAPARERFADLVLRNEQCQSLFFDLFMPRTTEGTSASIFRNKGVSVKWWHEKSPDDKNRVILQNKTTFRTALCVSPVSKNAVMYGLRYWARDELQLIDEFCAPSGATMIMFPVAPPSASSEIYDAVVKDTIRSILSMRASDEWAVFSIYELIVHCCEAKRRPRKVLFGAIDWLLKEWPHHVAAIPTSPTLATLDSRATSREDMALRRYYRRDRGPYISHIRVHRDVSVAPREEPDHV